MLIWKTPPIAKVYEAITAISDRRIELLSDNSARCYSSSRNKFYEITYDSASQLIMSNDSSAFYTDTLSYPMIAFLMLKGKITFDSMLLKPLSGILWKDVNRRYKNNYADAVEAVLMDLQGKGFDVQKIEVQVEKIYEQVKGLNLKYLGAKKRPPTGY